MAGLPRLTIVVVNKALVEAEQYHSGGEMVGSDSSSGSSCQCGEEGSGMCRCRWNVKARVRYSGIFIHAWLLSPTETWRPERTSIRWHTLVVCTRTAVLTVDKTAATDTHS